MLKYCRGAHVGDICLHNIIYYSNVLSTEDVSVQLLLWTTITKLRLFNNTAFG